MKLLLLGGPRFLGYALIVSARRRGHEVTLFNRGRSAPELFPGLEKRIGDRDGNLSALDGGRWDAVIDTCGYLPRIVRASAEKLRDAAEHYTFISSISVYTDPLRPPYDETLPVGTIEDERVEQITGETYGPLKALCEKSAEQAFPGQCLVVRPGLIVGPRDPSDRFTWWPVRAAAGGRILAPGSPDDPAQVIDVRDLADWIVRMVEARAAGVFNAIGEVIPMAELLSACLLAAGADGVLEWLPDDFLLENGVEPWTQIPLWLVGEDKDTMRASAARAVEMGLSFRPLAETARDTLAWARTLPGDYEWRAGLSAEREAALLKAWEMRNA